MPSGDSPDAAEVFTVLLEKVRSGDAAGAAEMEELFLPGLCTLLRLRVPPSEVEKTAQQILDAALARIHGAVQPITYDQLPGVICDTMHQLAPEVSSSPQVDSKRVERISKALMRTTPDERTILRHYYLHGWTIPQIALAVQLDETDIRKLISRLGKDWA